jgi:aminoglycoside phosphotransferase (APT) family kinase protein
MCAHVVPSADARQAAERVVAEINQQHGLHYVVRARCQGGMQGGAWLVTDPAGTQAVVKWRPAGRLRWRPRLGDIVSQIRATGYPTPRWIAAGDTSFGASYHVQDFVDGEPGNLASMASAALLVDVIEGHAGLDPDPPQDWSSYVSSCAREDRDDGPRRFLQRLGADGRDLIDHYDRVLAAHGPVELPGGDMVHGDFNSCNVLMHGGAVSGVIDVEALGSGTRAIDYAWLLREAWVEGAGDDVARLIRRAGERVAGPGVLALCVAATAFDIVRWQAVHDDPANVPGVMDSLHRLADDLATPL